MTERKLTPEQIEEARRRRLGGDAIKQLAGDYGVSSKTMQTYCKGITPESEPAEAREQQPYPHLVESFCQLLKRYGVKNADVVADFCSAVNLESPMELANKLKRTNIALPTRKQILEHWFQDLEIEVPPQALATVLAEPEVEPGTRPRRFVILNNTPVPDPEGDYSLTEALRIIEAKGQGSHESNELDSLREEIKGLYGVISKMRDEHQQEQLKSLSDEVSSLRLELRQNQRAASEYDVMGKFIDEVAGTIRTELPGMRRDMREALLTPRIPPPKSEEAREERRGRYREALAKDAKIEKLMTELFFSSPEPEPQPSAKRPPQPPYVVTYE